MSAAACHCSDPWRCISACGWPNRSVESDFDFHSLPLARFRPEADAHQGPLWGRAEATSASSGLRTAPPPSLSTWV